MKKVNDRHHLKNAHPQTAAIRCGYRRTAEREHSEAIFATSSFVFDDAAHAAALFADELPGNVYSRFTNPTVRAFENRLAALEGGRFGVATASGMAAVCALLLGLLKSGDRVVASNELFGASVSTFTKVFSRFGVHTTFVKLTDLDAWRSAIGDGAQLVFLESPSNPLCEIADVAAIAEMARAAGAPFAVDNAFFTPMLQRPLALGADIVMHTATKYLDGQGRCIGGALITNREDIYDELFATLRTTGACMSPFNAWVFIKGLEMLPLRMRQHCANAMRLAHYLANHPRVVRVHYPGLDSHPQHALATSLCADAFDGDGGYGGMLAFEVQGGRDEAWRIIDAVRLMSVTANLGDAKTTITHPATTTHGRITPQQRIAAGIGENLVRISVGLEHIDDLSADLARGLDSL